MRFMEKYPGIRTALVYSGVTIETLQGFLQKILSVYDEFAPVMSDNMGWKKQKPAHARHCAEEAKELASMLGLNELEQAFFAIIFAAHDLGRMTEGLRNSLDPEAPEKIRVTVTDEFRRRWPAIDQPKRMHGFDSEELLSPIFGPFAATRIGQWALLAVRHHSDVQNPTLEDMGGSVEALALANVLRDLDKVEGFRQAKSYTSDPERKARERLQNWPNQISKDPDWGKELQSIDYGECGDDTLTGLVDPLRLFSGGRALDRSKCRSYEAYMLQYLAWAKNIVEPCMLDVALAEGGPQIVAAYLLRQIWLNPFQYEALRAELERWNGGALLRAPVAS